VGKTLADESEELDPGAKNPQGETLEKQAADTGLELAIDVAPAGQEPQLVGKTVKAALKRIFFHQPLKGMAQVPLAQVQLSIWEDGTHCTGHARVVVADHACRRAAQTPQERLPVGL